MLGAPRRRAGAVHRIVPVPVLESTCGQSRESPYPADGGMRLTQAFAVLCSNYHGNETRPVAPGFVAGLPHTGWGGPCLASGAPSRTKEGGVM